MSEAKSQLATFRIDADKWDAFKRKARQSGASASEVLIGFIDSYLGDGGVPAPLPDASEIEDIKAKLERLDEIEARLDKLEEQQPGKSTPSEAEVLRRIA